MIVGIILPYLKSRGTEIQSLRISKGLVKKNVTVVLFIVQGWGEKNMYDKFLKIGVKVVNVGKSDKKGEKYLNFFKIFPLIKCIYDHKCNFLLSRATLTSRIAGYSGKILGIPVTSVLSGSINKKIVNNKLLSLIFSFLKYLSIGCPSNIISVSKYGSENFKNSYPYLASKVSYIQNGIELPSLFKNSYDIKNNETFKFFFSGSLDIERKGIDVLLNAIQILIFTYNIKNISIILIGSGSDKKKISALSKKLNIENNVQFLGEIDNPIDKIIELDAFILPSRREGMPNALLEAMSIGIPCIATDCNTGPKEIIEHNQNGLLVETENSIALASSMKKIYYSKKLRELLGNNARKTIKNYFSLDKMINQYFLLFD